MPMLALIASTARDMERLFEDWRAPLIILAVGGFAIAVLGHLTRTRAMIVTGILMVCLALVVGPALLWVRGSP